MALTLTKISGASFTISNKKLRVYDVTFDSSYPTGGESLTAADVGLKKIEQFNLRRQARLTGRLVPMYRSREVDSTMRPVRVRPPIDPIEPTPFEDEDEYWAEHGREADPFSSDLGAGGWAGIGTGGG